MLSRTRPSTPVSHDAPDPFMIPDPVDVSVELRELLVRKQQFEDQASLLKRELDESVAAGQKKRRQARVANILEGKPRVADQHRDPGEIYDELGDVQEVIEQLGDQIHGARLKASAAIRPMVAPEHCRLVGDMARAMIEMRDAWLKYLQFADELNAKAISWAGAPKLHPMHPHYLGDPRDNQSATAFWLCEAVANDLIDREKLPKHIQIWLWGEAR